MDQYLDAEERMLTEISDSNGIVRPQKLSNKETKALPKQEGPNIFGGDFFLNCHLQCFSREEEFSKLPSKNFSKLYDI